MWGWKFRAEFKFVSLLIALQAWFWFMFKGIAFSFQRSSVPYPFFNVVQLIATLALCCSIIFFNLDPAPFISDSRSAFLSYSAWFFCETVTLAGIVYLPKQVIYFIFSFIKLYWIIIAFIYCNKKLSTKNSLISWDFQKNQFFSLARFTSIFITFVQTQSKI